MGSGRSFPARATLMVSGNLGGGGDNLIKARLPTRLETDNVPKAESKDRLMMIG